VIDLPILAADPGVALKASVENTTADATAIVRIVFITLSGKSEGLVYFEMSTVVVGAEALAMKLLRVLRDIENPATPPLSVDANSVCEEPGLVEMYSFASQ
jgi:hypothetical protein